MKSVATKNFWKAYRRLPDETKNRTIDAYQLWLDNPAHPSLHFKRLWADKPLYSVRIGLDFRALGKLDGETMTWHWIGRHDDYERMIHGS